MEDSRDFGTYLVDTDTVRLSLLSDDFLVLGGEISSAVLLRGSHKHFHGSVGFTLENCFKYKRYNVHTFQNNFKRPSRKLRYT